MAVDDKLTEWPLARLYGKKPYHIKGFQIDIAPRWSPAGAPRRKRRFTTSSAPPAILLRWMDIKYVFLHRDDSLLPFLRGCLMEQGKWTAICYVAPQLPHAVRVESEKISSADFLLRIVKCIPLFIIIRVIPAALLMLPISLSNSSWPWVQCRTGGDDGSLPSRHQNHSMQKWPAPAAAASQQYRTWDGFWKLLLLVIRLCVGGDRRAIGTGAYSP